MRETRFDLWVGKIPRRMKWLLTPVFLPGISHGQKKLVGYSSESFKKLDATERLGQAHISKHHIVCHKCV